MFVDNRPMPLTTPPTSIATESRHLSYLSGERRRQFDPDAVSDHDRLAGQLSVLAYELQVDAQHTLRRTGDWSQVIVCSSPLGAQAICGVHDGEAWIAFRGTKQLIDVAIDALVVPVRSHHLGFWLAWHSLEAKITRWLREIGAEAIHLTGHSLGGAMALVAALDLAGKDSPATPYPIASVVTFAAPRAFRLKAKTAYANATSRVRGHNRSLSQVTTSYEHKRDVIRRLAHVVGYQPVGSSVELPDTRQHLRHFVKQASPLMQLVAVIGGAGWLFDTQFGATEHVLSAIILIFACMTIVTALRLTAQSVGSHAAVRYVAMIGATPLPVHHSPTRQLPALKATIGALVALTLLAAIAYATGVASWFGSVVPAMTLRFVLLSAAILVCGWLATAWGRKGR